MAFRYLQSMISFIQSYGYCAIVQHWGVDGDTTHSSFQLAKDLADGITDGPIPNYGIAGLQTVMAEDCFVSSVRCREVAVANAPSYFRAFTPDAFVGSFSGNAGANQVAACLILLSSGDAGLTGRVFIPCVSEEAMVGGRFTSDYKIALNDVISGFAAGVLGTFHSYTPFIKHGAPAAFAEVEHVYLSATPGTQRRRLIPL